MYPSSRQISAKDHLKMKTKLSFCAAQSGGEHRVELWLLSLSYIPVRTVWQTQNPTVSQ
jgi:hypothetical protein